MQELGRGRDEPRLLTRYRDVRAALSDPQFVIYKPLAVGDEAQHIVSRPTDAERSHRLGPLWRTLSEQLAPAMVQQLSEGIEALVDEILEEAERRGGMEVVNDLAFPLPLAVMGELLGLPKLDYLQLRPLFESVTRGHDIGASRIDRQKALFAQAALTRWLSPLVRKGRPSAFRAALEGAVNAGEISAKLFDYACMMLLYAGSVTTRDLIANTIAVLLEHPEAARKLQAQPALIPTAIGEILRFNGPVRGVGRVATRDLTIGDHHISGGELVYLMLHDANHDSERFAEPSKLDIERAPNPHLAFGLGSTFCLGSHLARLETRILLQKMLKLLPNMAMTGPADWSDLRLMSQRASLNVSIHFT